MENFVYEYPTKVLFGKGAAKEHLGKTLSVYGPNVMLACGGGSIYKNGIYDEMMEILVAAQAVLDPDYTMSVPFSQVMSGAFDTLSHAMEAYFGRADRDNVSDDLAEAVMRNTIRNMRTLLREPNDYAARSNLMWDSALAENGILKCGRVTDFQAHQIEHRLGAYTDCNHGQGLAVIHPALYRVMCQKAPGKFARFAVKVWGIPQKGSSELELAHAGVDTLESFIRECGLPAHLKELRMAAELLSPETLKEIADSCSLIQTGQAQVNHEEIFSILNSCL